MSKSSKPETMDGAVPLSTAIDSLRDELVNSMWNSESPYRINGRDYKLRFKPSPVELTLDVVATLKGGGDIGVRWWLVSGKASGAFESAARQTLKITIEPTLIDVATGSPAEFKIDSPELPGAPSGHLFAE